MEDTSTVTSIITTGKANATLSRGLQPVGSSAMLAFPVVMMLVTVLVYSTPVPS